MIYFIKIFSLIAILFFAVYFDVKKFKIPNKITSTGVIFGLLINSIFYGLEGLKDSSLGLAVPFLILFVLYALKMLGAGDVKLFSAIGSIMGIGFVLQSMVTSILAGGVIAIVFMLVRKNFFKRFKYLLSYLKLCFLTVEVHTYQEFNENNNGIFRFSYAIFVGTIAVLIMTSL